MQSMSPNTLTAGGGYLIVILGVSYDDGKKYLQKCAAIKTDTRIEINSHHCQKRRSN
jgi:hypothetical protein